MNSEIRDYDQISLTEIQPIKRNRGANIHHREELKDIVEYPLLGTAEIFYDKNIETNESNANVVDLRRPIGITIGYDTLSEENKAIADQMENASKYSNNGRDYISITMPAELTTTVEQVKENMEAKANQFKWQPLDWMPVYTMEDMGKRFKPQPGEEELTAEDFIDAGYYYDKDSGKFYINAEQFNRAQQKGPA